MLLVTPLLPQPYEKRWRAKLGQIARIVRGQFYAAASTMFLGAIDPRTAKSGCIYKTADTDFGRTTKTYWMLYFTARRFSHRCPRSSFAAAAAGRYSEPRARGEDRCR